MNYNKLYYSMKKNNLIKLILTFFLCISYINSQNLLFSLSNELLSEEKNNETNNELDYLNLLIKIISNIKPECSSELENYYNKSKNKFSLSKYPLMVEYIGKSINELGDEIECRQIFKDYNLTYTLAKLNPSFLTNKTDKELLNFLEVRDICIGFCIPKSCKEPVVKVLKLFMNISDDDIRNNNQTSYKINNDSFLIEEEPSKGDYNFIQNLSYLVLYYLIIKMITGIIRKIICVKGYDKYANKLLKDQGITDQLENDDKENLVYLDNNEEPNNYNPKFDFTSSLPLYLRFVKFLDFFNDLHYFFSKRNRYFNDNGLESINFIRAIVLYLLIFSNTSNSLLSLPLRDILNKSLINTITILSIRISSVSLNYWIVLEAAYTSFKLMKFIKAQMFIYHKKNKKNFNINLLIIFGKFILLFIPKIYIFLLCYYIFYYKVIEFKILFKAKTTFEYIINYVLKRDITCSNDIFDIFLNPLIFSNDISAFKQCYNFIFVYFNIFLCSFVFMIILYFSFIIKQKIFEIILIIINVLLFFTLLFYVNDGKIDKDTKYTYYHLKGQEYTTKIFYLSLGVYNFGYILGILCFNYDNNKDSFNQKKNKKKSIDHTIPKKRDSYKITRTFNLDYYPLSFFNKFLELLSRTNSAIKYCIILLCIILMILLSLIDRFEYNESGYTLLNKQFYNKLSKSKFYFLYYKHISLLLFFIINIIVITLPKKGIYKQIVNIKFFTVLSRIGFSITCLYYFFGYFSFCELIVKIKLNIMTFILLSIGNFLNVILICLLFNIIFELPIRMIIKKLFRINKIKKNKLDNDRE